MMGQVVEQVVKTKLITKKSPFKSFRVTVRPFSSISEKSARCRIVAAGMTGRACLTGRSDATPASWLCRTNKSPQNTAAVNRPKPSTKQRMIRSLLFDGDGAMSGTSRISALMEGRRQNAENTNNQNDG